VRLRVVLGVAVVAAVSALALDMSGTAPRTAGSDHNSPVVFSAVIPGGGTLCQADSAPPSDTATAVLMVGTYGYAVPELGLTFLDATGHVVSSGRRPAGGGQGDVTIPLSRARGEASRACLHVGGVRRLAVGGEEGAVNSGDEIINGALQGGRISLSYYRPGRESWWQLLPTLSRRFGLGKASFFGSWTLAAMALLLVGVWVATIRLLLRELA
jgi:hypothetical protein